MKGAHCIACLDKGPDLVITEDVQAVTGRPPDGLVADIEFRCGSCGRRWAWRARFEAGSWIYSPVATTLAPAPSTTH